MKDQPEEKLTYIDCKQCGFQGVLTVHNERTCCKDCGLPHMHNVDHVCDEKEKEKLAKLNAINPKDIVLEHGECGYYGDSEVSEKTGCKCGCGGNNIYCDTHHCSETCKDYNGTRKYSSPQPKEVEVSEWEEKLKYDFKGKEDLANWWIDYFKTEFRNQILEKVLLEIDKKSPARIDLIEKYGTSPFHDDSGYVKSFYDDAFDTTK